MIGLLLILFGIVAIYFLFKILEELINQGLAITHPALFGILAGFLAVGGACPLGVGLSILGGSHFYPELLGINTK